MAARALIDRVEIYPAQEGTREPRIELLGHLASMLRLAGAFGSGNAKSPPAGADGLCLFLSSAKEGQGPAYGEHGWLTSSRPMTSVRFASAPAILGRPVVYARRRRSW